MRNWIILFLMLFLSINSFAQFPNKQTIGSGTTLNVALGAYGSDSGYVYRYSFADTLTANRGFIKNIPGIQIRVVDTLFLRNYNATKWNSIAVTSINNASGIDSIRRLSGSTQVQGLKNGTWLNQFTDSVNNTNAPVCQGLSSGGIVTLNSGMILNVTNASYCILGTSYTSPSTSLTLATADATFPRKDIIVVNTSGVAVIVQGTPAANPIQPQINPSTQIFLATVDIPAGASTPANVTRTVIYNENIEWTSASTLTSGTVNFNNSTSPYIGSKSADISTGSLGVITFTKSDTVSINNYDVFQMFLRPKAAIADASKIEVALTFGGALVSNYVNVTNGYGYIKTAFGSYQNISISKASFLPVTTDSINGISIRFTGANSGFYLDYVQFQSGIIPPIPATDGRYWKLNFRDTTTTTKMLLDTLSLGRLQPTSILPMPSAALEFQTYVYDSLNAIQRGAYFRQYVQGSAGTAIPNYNWLLKSPYATPITANANGNVTFANGVTLDKLGVLPRIYANSTLNYQTNATTTPQHFFGNQIGSSLLAPVLEISIGNNTTVSASARIVNVIGNRNDSSLSIKPEGNVGIGIGSPNPYANLHVASKGKGVILDTMNTAKRDGIKWQVAAITITDPGHGYNLPPTISSSSPVGGLDAALTSTISSGGVTGGTVLFGGSGYSSGGALIFNNTGTGGTGAAGTYSVTAGTIPKGLMIFNTDSSFYEFWDGTAWIGMKGGTGGGGSTPTWQQSLTAGSTLTTDNTVDIGNNQLWIQNSAGGGVAVLGTTGVNATTIGDIHDSADGTALVVDQAHRRIRLTADNGTEIVDTAGIKYLYHFTPTDSVLVPKWYVDSLLQALRDSAKNATFDSTQFNVTTTGGGVNVSLKENRRVYKAILTQNTVNITSGTLVIGQSYKIDALNGGDDFSNVGYVSDGAAFVATGTTPTDWSNGSSVLDYTASAPVATVLGVNTIGAIVWSYSSTGIYYGTLAGAFTGSIGATSISQDLTEDYAYKIVIIGKQDSDNIIFKNVDLTGSVFDGFKQYVEIYAY